MKRGTEHGRPPFDSEQPDSRGEVEPGSYYPLKESEEVRFPDAPPSRSSSVRKRSIPGKKAVATMAATGALAAFALDRALDRGTSPVSSRNAEQAERAYDRAQQQDQLNDEAARRLEQESSAPSEQWSLPGANVDDTPDSTSEVPPVIPPDEVDMDSLEEADQENLRPNTPEEQAEHDAFIQENTP